MLSGEMAMAPLCITARYIYDSGMDCNSLWNGSCVIVDGWMDGQVGSSGMILAGPPVVSSSRPVMVDEPRRDHHHPLHFAVTTKGPAAPAAARSTKRTKMAIHTTPPRMCTSLVLLWLGNCDGMLCLQACGGI